MQHYTYSHNKPDGTPFYIGKGVGKRAYSKRRNVYWKRVAEKYGYEVQILAYWKTNKEALDHEMLLISCFKDMGIELTNMTNGGLDYQVAILALENYNQIGLKTLNGPWPKALYYNPNSDTGNVFVWPNPAQGEMHMFSSTIFSNYESIYDDIILPQGYSMALRWNLAERLMPMYGKSSATQISMINAYAAQSKSTIKRNNMQPIAAAGYPDSMLVGRAKDAGWILSGGFFR